MKNKSLILVLIVLTAIISYQFIWVNYILLTIIFLLLVLLLLFGVVAIFRKPNIKLFKITLIVIGISTAGIVVSLFSPYQDAIIHSENISEQLHYAYTTDQTDRKTMKSFIGYFSRLKERDSIRLNQVREIYNQEKFSSSMDKFHAAFVFHHGNDSNDFKIAYKLSAEAAKDKDLIDNYIVQWLQKAAYDRWMVSIGQPEKFNTQNKFSIDFK